MIDVIDAWLRLAAAALHDQAADPDRARPGDRRRRPRHEHGPRLRGHRRRSLDGGRPEGDESGAVAAARLRTAGRTLISTVGGAAGPLYGTAFMRAGGRGRRGRPDRRPAPRLVAALDAAIGGIQALGKATTGEKTMLDALVPARRGRPERPRRAAPTPPPSPQRWPTPPRPARPPRSRCSRRRAARPTSASVDRPPGSGRDVGRAAAPRARRRRRRRLTPDRHGPAPARSATRTGLAVLIGRPARPGVGIGRVLRRARHAARPRPAAAPATAADSTPPTERARLRAALDSAADRARGAGGRHGGPGRARRSARSSRRRRCSRATRASSIRRSRGRGGRRPPTRRSSQSTSEQADGLAAVDDDVLPRTGGRRP